MNFKPVALMVGVLLFWPTGSISARPELVDSDGDGIPDIYETQGVRDKNGKMLVDLKAMGADPKHKDLFIQCDWMASETHTHKPKSDALRIVIEAFANSPVANPDGTTGIHLHVDAGPKSVMNPVTGAKWEHLSQAHEVPHLDNLGTEDASGSYDWQPLDLIKVESFALARTPVFRYCLWAHDYAHSGSSGIARGLPGDDFLVTLGTFEGEAGTVLEQAGTFMHELGHTLGLEHGGSDSENFKPNFLSIMSYLYQFQGLRIDGLDGTFDYSRFAVPSLKETALLPTIAGIPPGYGVRWRVVHNGQTIDLVSDQASHVDWIQQGHESPTALSLDVNGDGQVGELKGVPDEWEALSYVGDAVGDFTDVPTPGVKPTQGAHRAPPPRFTQNKETATRKEADLIHPDYEVSLEMADGVKGVPNSTVILHLVIENEGTKADTYVLSAEQDEGWADLRKLPKTVSVAAGKSLTIDIPVHVPANAKPGQVETVGVEAVSQANHKILDETEGTVIVPKF